MGLFPPGHSIPRSDGIFITPDRLCFMFNFSKRICVFYLPPQCRKHSKPSFSSTEKSVVSQLAENYRKTTGVPPCQFQLIARHLEEIHRPGMSNMFYRNKTETSSFSFPLKYLSYFWRVFPYPSCSRQQSRQSETQYLAVIECDHPLAAVKCTVMILLTGITCSSMSLSQYGSQLLLT